MHLIRLAILLDPTAQGVENQTHRYMVIPPFHRACCVWRRLVLRRASEAFQLGKPPVVCLHETNGKAARLEGDGLVGALFAAVRVFDDDPRRRCGISAPCGQPRIVANGLGDLLLRLEAVGKPDWLARRERSPSEEDRPARVAQRTLGGFEEGGRPLQRD